MSGEKKQTVITFKAEGEILEALNKIQNKSEFIREALLAALDESCPLCGGRGFLTPRQRLHWNMFTKFHKVGHCAKCDALMIECGKNTFANKKECC